MLLLLAAPFIGGCAGWQKPEPDPQHMAEVNKLFSDRYQATLDTTQLLKTDMRAPVEGPTGTLTFDEAVHKALAHNLALVAQSESQAVAQANLVQAGLWENPNFGQTSAFYFPAFGGTAAATSFDLLIQQTINTFLTQPQKVAVAKAQRFQAGIDTANQAFQLAQQTQAQYRQLVHLKRDGDLQRRIADTYKRAVEAAQAELKVGLVTRSDFNRAVIQYEDALRQAHHYDTQYEGAAQQMNWLMGVQAAPRWTLPESIKGPPRVISALPNQPRLEELAGRYRLDLLRARFDQRIAQINVDLAQKNLFPQTTIGFDAARDSAKNWLAGPDFQITLPIFDPGIVALWNARYEKEQADRNVLAFQGQVKQDVRNALNALQIAAEDVIFYRDRTIPQEEENVKLAELSFKLGNSDLDDLMNSIREYVGVLQNYEDAIQSYNEAVIALESAVGLAFPRIEQEAIGTIGKATTGAVVPGFKINPMGTTTGPATLPGGAALPHRPFQLEETAQPATMPTSTALPAATQPVTTPPATTQPHGLWPYPELPGHKPFQILDDSGKDAQ